MYFSEKKSFKNCLWKVSQFDEKKELAIYQKFGFSEILSMLFDNHIIRWNAEKINHAHPEENSNPTKKLLPQITKIFFLGIMEKFFDIFLIWWYYY